MTLGRTQCLYNAHRVAPLPPSCPLCSEVYAPLSCAKQDLRHLHCIKVSSGLTHARTDSFRAGDALKSKFQIQWRPFIRVSEERGGRFPRTVGAFIPSVTRADYFPGGLEGISEGPRLAPPPRRSTFASFLLVDLPHRGLLA